MESLSQAVIVSTSSMARLSYYSTVLYLPFVCVSVLSVVRLISLGDNYFASTIVRREF
eukprot:m.40411 g.40411  ORF g.40411 m.40411 type:complete len:58 (+) comp32966_c0_seq2:727-900(+)